MSHPDGAQLVDQIMKARAQEYAASRARFDARRPELEKAAQAHEQKQLQIMRAAGVKVQELDDEHATLIKDLDANLERVRPTLTGRTDSLAIDAKNRSVLLNQFGQTIIVAPVGYYSPPEPWPPVVSSGWVFANTSRITIKAT